MGRQLGPASLAQSGTAGLKSASVSQPNNVPRKIINGGVLGKVEPVILAQSGISNLPLPRSPELWPVSTTSELLKKDTFPERMVLYLIKTECYLMIYGSRLKKQKLNLR